ncbi:MAG: ABC transporter substrate-binding protein [Pseudomonadota bacterium]
MGLNTAPVTLDPRFATDAVSYRLTRLIYQNLIDFDDNFQVISGITDWDQIALNHYRFSINKKSASFHNGVQLTAHDIKATYDSVLNPDTVSPHRGSIEMIESIKVIDNQIVDFYLNRDDPLFPGRLVISILPADLIKSGHTFQNLPIGSGPFKFISWDDEVKLKLTRIVDQQVFNFFTVKDPTVRVLKLLRGELDILQGNLSPEIVTWLSEKQSIEVHKRAGDTFTYIGFNLQDKHTGNQEIRQAIAYAVDRNAIIQFVMQENARLAAAILPPVHWAGYPGLQGIDYAPEEAQKILKQYGYDQSNPLNLTYKTSNNPFRLRLATIIQSQLKEVGIELDIQSYDWGTFYSDIKQGRFQMYSLSWVGLKMPDIFRYVFHSDAIPPKGANRGRLVDTKVDTFIERAETEPDLTSQAENYRQLQRYLLDVLPYVPLWYEDTIMARQMDIEGYELAADGNFDALINVKRITPDD